MTMKNGFSTINRLLGKQRESSNLSKSTTNLSVTKSTVNINDSSQLHQNRITPLPIATSNAPFEQTFRITVLLPRDQLYVARLGAKVRLHKLMQLVCENKQLDADKYEFQHPADPSQIFSCDLTIGAVGLSEIRLCTKSENNNTLRVEDVTSSSRHNSFSSSKFSRNSKNISNTPSLYSSINSLNSMSSSGIDTTYRNISPATTPTKPMAPVVPTRKKRLAPRPPSQILTVDSDAVSTKTFESATSNQSSSIIKTEFVSSSNNLDSRLEQTVLGTNNNNNDLSKSNISIDCNGNTKGSLHQPNEGCINEQCQETTQTKILLKSQSSLCISTNDDTSPNGIENNSSINQPEPSPRRKVQTLPKKSVPVAPPRSTKPPIELIEETQPEDKVSTALLITPVPLPRSASMENLISEPIVDNSKNITKIHMNPSPTPESNSVLQTEEVKSAPIELVDEEVKEPILDGKESWKSSTPSLESKHKSFIESSSEDDEMVKVYDLSLRKTIVKSLSNHKTSEVIEVASTNKESHQPSSPAAEKNTVKSPDLVDSSEKKVIKDIPVEPEVKIEVNLSIAEAQQPLSSPVKENLESSVPTKTQEHQNNTLIEDEPSKHIEEQRITEEVKKVENIDVIKCEELSPKPAEIIEKIKEVILETLPVKPDLPKLQEIPKTPESDTKLLITQPVVELETPNSKVIDNTITITNGTDETNLSNKQKPLLTTLERLGGDEELESIPDTAIQSTKHSLAARSSSFLSLTQFEFKNQRNQNTTDDYFSRRRSSSELSIGESPSLQSIGVMKSILNSRKSSLCGSDESKTPPIECDIHPMEEPSPKSKNNIFKTNTTIKSSEEKVYRYSGPPNIQFSTWSERPKVQVSIKDEQDCNLDKNKSGQKSPPTSIAVSKPDLVVLQRNNMNSGRDLDLVRNTQKVTLRENSISSNYSKPQNPIPTYTIPKFILGSRTSWSVATAASAVSNGNSSLTQDNRPPINQKPILRPTSMTQLNSSSVIRQTPSPSSPPPPVFGQGTLRKTGFKEKIVPLQDTNDTDVSKPIPFTLKNNQTKPQITPKTFIHSSSRTETPVSVAAVPQAPPPPPIIRAVVTKQRSQMPSSLSVDPRDQLLSAIRNFKLDELKNSNIK
ncbi:mucin-17 [Episyrphus balteatus]|uniref:mucin-17 n=1 Tax=Episyrphus balteatus TaxID=286459 RepID=UPI002486BECC|nr:mucin-17 [Episyrphus balteatus]XP_055855927.1 mucin-17 [Episyrphus balteatus]XP_055855928.1 mucin-17 [Episyrphus balteatus]